MSSNNKPTELNAETYANEKSKTQPHLTSQYDDELTDDEYQCLDLVFGENNPLFMKAKEEPPPPPVKKILIGDCMICSEKYNLSTRKGVECCFCEYQACRKCWETYFLTTSVPKCMNPECNKEWKHPFLLQNFTQKFVKETLKQHQLQVLFEKEQALFPETQLVMEFIQTGRPEATRMRQQAFELRRTIDDLNRQASRLEQIIQHAHKTGIIPPNDFEFGNFGKKEHVQRFVRACPAEGCRGFLTSRWKCGICNKDTCSQCHELKIENQEHICNPDNVATAKLLNKDTKPCPTCASLIFKIDGCDQMWCIECKTAFSWKTGIIEKNIHNPHYYEYMRKTNAQELERMAREQNCREEGLNNHAIRQEILKLFNIHNGGKNQYIADSNFRQIIQNTTFYIDNVTEICNHFHGNEINRFRTLIEESIGNKVDLRMQYLCGEISETAFKNKMLFYVKTNKANQELLELCELYYRVMCDIFNKFYHQLHTRNSKFVHDLKCDIKMDRFYKTDFVKEISNITKYVNENMDLISQTYDISRLNLQDITDLKILRNALQSRKLIVKLSKKQI